MKKLMMMCFFMISLLHVAGQSKNETAVAAALERLRLAMINADKTELENLTADELSYGHSSGYVEGKDEFVEKIVSGKSDFVTIEISGQSIIIKGNTAVVRHNLNATTNDSRKPGTVQIKILQVWIKDGSKWKLLARQAVKSV